MLPEPILINKSMQNRLEEYQELLETIHTPCSEINEIWGSVFEDLVIIDVNWQALWLLSEEKCKKYEVLYPSSVIVDVYELNWENLTATVKVLAAQDDISTPSMLDVSIIDLHPIKGQNFDETNLKVIADWLDKCRFFFKNLWYSWDAKDEVVMSEWCELHLENRLKMHYDLKCGVFDKRTENYLKSLLKKAKNIDTVFKDESEDDSLVVVRNYIEKEILKAELDIFEEPYLRYGIIKLKSNKKSFNNSINSFEKCEKQESIFVWSGGSYETLSEYLKIGSSMINRDVTIKISRSFQEALDVCNVNDIILLPPGEHVMSSLKGAEVGNKNIIKGFGKFESLIVPDLSCTQRTILFDCFGNVEIENLSITKSKGIALQVFEGLTKISKCKIECNDRNVTSRGLVVISGSTLVIEDCEVEGFEIGIVLQKGATVSIKNSKISNCHEGIMMSENSHLSLNDVEISSCSAFGFRFETSKMESDMPLIGDISLLSESNLNCDVSYTNVTFNNNHKGDVLVRKTPEIISLLDADESDVSDEIICISDDDKNTDSDSLMDIQIAMKKAL